MKLSKTNFITYRECKKNAWLKIHKPDIYYQYPLSSFEQNIIDIGNQIDTLARDLFPNGVLVENREDTSYTAKLIEDKAPAIYQPVFISDNYITASDILVYNDQTGVYDLYEVKASTSSEEDGARKTKDYLIDMAFQKIVLRDLNIPLGTTNLIRLNKEYVREGDISLKQLFLIEDLSQEVNDILDQIELEMKKAHEVLSNETEPHGFCDCILKGRNSQCTTSKYSNPGLPEYSVHDIARIGSSKRKLAELVDSNIFDIQDVPSDFDLSDIQRRQVDTAQSGQPYIDRDGINQFLETIQYPIAFLDYETYPSALPRFDGYKPYQQIPFQFSLHVLESPDSELKHYEFLHTTPDNPDIPFALALQKYLPKSGSVVVWNKMFEKGRNMDIATRAPQFHDFMVDINNRVVDLMIPFSGKTLVYDHPKFKGSASIKYILPALVPHLSYKSLHIQEGGTASDTWNRVVSGEYDIEEKDMKIQALKDYCCLDTLAMVEVWKALKKED